MVYPHPAGRYAGGVRVYPRPHRREHGYLCGLCHPGHSRGHRIHSGPGDTVGDRDPHNRGIPEGLPAQPVCGGGILRAAPGVHGHGGRSGPVRGGYHPAEHRSHGPGDCKLEGIGSGGGDPGADPLGEAHQGPTPHCVHPGLRRGGDRVRFLNTDSDTSE